MEPGHGQAPRCQTQHFSEPLSAHACWQWHGPSPSWTPAGRSTNVRGSNGLACWRAQAGGRRRRDDGGQRTCMARAAACLVAGRHGRLYCAQYTAYCLPRVIDRVDRFLAPAWPLPRLQFCGTHMHAEVLLDRSFYWSPWRWEAVLRLGRKVHRPRARANVTLLVCDVSWQETHVGDSRCCVLHSDRPTSRR